MLKTRNSINDNLKLLTQDIIGKSEDLINFKQKFPVNKAMLNKTMMVIEGKKVSVKKFLIFEIYCKTGSISKTAEICDVSTTYLYKMRNEEWFGALQYEFIDSRQRHMHMELAERSELLTKAIVRIWDGSADPKLASALVRSFEAYCKLGKLYGTKFVEPLISNKQEINIDNRTVETHNHKIDIDKAILNMTPEQIDNYSRTGILPESITEAAEAEAIAEDSEALENQKFEHFDPEEL